MSDSRTTPPDSAHRALALELDAALANDPLVDELAFVPSATLADLFGPNARTHPPGAVVSAAVPGAFALIEHKLAVAVSALAPLHAFAREALRRADAADLDRTENENRGERDDDRRAMRDVGVDPDTRADALRLLLLVNGDHATAWNRRKRRLIANCAAAERSEARASDGTPENEKQKQLVSDELAFCALALSRFPKAQAAWAHRRWVICTFESATRGVRFRETGKAVPSRARFASESEVARVACLRKRLNYAAWAHCRWCALGRRGGALAAEGALAEGAPVPHEGASTRTRLVDEELERTERFVRVNVSDYCGLHYRQALLTSKAFGASATTRDFLRDEAELASSLIARFPGREALWAHRRFVFDARLKCGGDEGRAAPGPSDARERETRGDDDDDDDENENENENENQNARFFSALLAEELAFADARVSTRDDSASRDDSDATPDPSAVHPSWAEHPAAEQARFAAAHALWALEAARRAGVRGAVGAAGAARRAAAAEALAAAWPWGAAATRGMRRARVGGGARGGSGASLERDGV